MTVDLSELLTVAQAARRTPFSEPAIRNRIARGEIPCVRLGGNIYVAESALEAALGELYQPASA